MELLDKPDHPGRCGQQTRPAPPAAFAGAARQNRNTSSSIGSCCHSFSADGRCITLLKVLMTNSCVYDCRYCVNRRSNDTRRAAFTPKELAELTIQFYRRNYIEGLFLSPRVSCAARTTQPNR